MNILIINVSLRPESPNKLFPVGLGYIVSAIKKAGFDFDLLDIDAHRYSDDEIERVIGNKKYDVVCMGCIVTGYRIVKRLSFTVRKIHPRAKIIVGNSVATSIPDTLLTKTEADIAVIGEGDETIVDLLQAINESRQLEDVSGICFIRNGKVVQNPSRPRIRDISKIPFIEFDEFDIEIYIESTKNMINDPLPMARDQIRAFPVNTARGCISDCTFCYHVFKNYPFRFRSVESIVAEIKSLIHKCSVNYIMLWDELSFFSKKQALQFAQTLLSQNIQIYWTGNCRGDLFNNDDDIEILKMMKQAGCIGLGFSLESAELSILKAMNKKMTPEQFSKQTQLLHKAGLAAWTSLVFGYPQETPDTIKKTFDCCIENRVYPSAGYLLPQPGSQMYSYAVEHGFIPDEEEYLLSLGDRQDLRLNMTQMTDDEFESYVVNGLNRCNQELNIGLEEEQLIKSQYYKVADTDLSS